MSVRKSKLRAVRPDEKPDLTLTESLEDAIASGDDIRILLAQRRSMVAALPELKGPALAALHRQIMLASKEIAALRAKASGEVVPGVEVDDEDFDIEAI